MDGVVDAVKEYFDNALHTAKDVLARVQSGDPTVTQNEVDSAWRNLIKAIQYGEFKAGDKTGARKGNCPCRRDEQPAGQISGSGQS